VADASILVVHAVVRPRAYVDSGSSYGADSAEADDQQPKTDADHCFFIDLLLY
jgi:hypothetical protein